MKILALPKYGRLGASSRMRTFQYIPWLRDAGLEVSVSSFFSDDSLQRRYRDGRYGLWTLLYAYLNRVKILINIQKFDLVWIEKEALPWFPAFLERFLLKKVPYVLDYDDAIFHAYDMHRSVLLRTLFHSRLDKLMRSAALVVAGNNYLAQRAVASGAEQVEVIPTVIDLFRYELRSEEGLRSADGLPRIVWIGSPSSAKYIDQLREPLKRLAMDVDFKLRIIGGGEIEIAGVDVETVDWSEKTEVHYISECDIGVMPLSDSPWEQGKCGYKLIQYMASCLPVIASNVGVNSELVLHGENGFLVTTAGEWEEHLRSLLLDESRRIRMGQLGRGQVASFYSLQVTGPRLAELLRELQVRTA